MPYMEGCVILGGMLALNKRSIKLVLTVVSLWGCTFVRLASCSITIKVVEFIELVGERFSFIVINVGVATRIC